MAVLFFYTLLGWHPLDGRREYSAQILDAETENKLYGTEPLFLFDPTDGSNGPVSGFHDPIVARWNSLNGALRALFVRSFGAGLHDPSARVLETEWRAPLQALIDTAFACATCGYEHGADWRGEVLTGPFACVACGTSDGAPDALRIGRRMFSLSSGRTLSPDALGNASRASVDAHPTRPDLLGLCNRGQTQWQATPPSGQSHTIAAGQTVRLLPGLQINFGSETGIVCPARQGSLT